MPSPSGCVRTPFTCCSCLLTLALVILPTRPVQASLTRRTAQCEAQVAQARLHRQQQRKARQAKGHDPAKPRATAAPLQARAGFGLSKLLQPGLLFLLATTSGHPQTSFGQPLDGQYPWSNLQSFDPSAGNSTLSQSLQLALTRANTTGDLPTLAELNAYLAERSPQKVSPLAALTEALPAATSGQTTPGANLPPLSTTLTLSGPPPLPTQELSPAASKALTDEMLAVMTTLTAARLIETQATLLSISYQILTAATLQTTSVEAGTALRVVALELQSLGFAFGARASHEQARSAERILGNLETKAKAKSEAEAKTQVQTASSSGSTFNTQAAPLERAGLLDPTFIYGTWQRLETSLPGELVLYKISRNELVKIATRTDRRGRRAVHSENHPGVVTGTVTYLLPDEVIGPGEADGTIAVQVRVDQANGQRMELDFSFLQAQGAALDGATQLRMEVLIEQDGDRKAFVKIANI